MSPERYSLIVATVGNVVCHAIAGVGTYRYEPEWFGRWLGVAALSSAILGLAWVVHFLRGCDEP